ncbi:hypothetical protein M514_10313 [Trichuris suis]|uniref:Uncharacterized protein n=1 Tax=Trichuris suis TaxID=68888 RepID=A0A085NIR6_9BILA|nr:hypothetical protein M514_10313 [Trichuris suis]KHJ41168.1 hypothetical protein D918_08755 [Trichuris suis]
MITDSLYFSHIRNKKKYQKCKKRCPLCKFSWKITKKCHCLPPAFLDLFDRRALISKQDGSIITCVSMALLVICQELQFQHSFSSCQNSSAFAELRFDECFKGYAGVTSHFLKDCATVVFALLEIGLTSQQWLDWMSNQLHTWSRCISLFKRFKRVSSVSMTDEMYTYILALLLKEDRKLRNDIVGPIVGLGDRVRSVYRKKILSRYSLVTLENGTQFLTSLLYSNPLSSAVIVDTDTGRILLSSTMAQEILWTPPLPFSHCNEKLFKGMGNLLQNYFCVLSKAGIVESFDKLSTAIPWERSSGRQRISCGLRAEVFGHAGQTANQKLVQIEKLDSLIRESDPVSSISIPCLEFGHTFLDICKHAEQHSCLDRSIRSCGYNALMMRQALLYRKWTLAVRMLQNVGHYFAPNRRFAFKRRLAVAQRFAWKLGLHLLTEQYDDAKFNNKVRAFLSHVLRKHWAINKMDAFVDVYLLLNMKSGEHEASRFSVVASAYVSDLVDDDRRSMALISAYETLFSYRNANRSLLNFEGDASQSLVTEVFPNIITMRESMRAHLDLLRSGQLFLETLADMYESSASLSDLFKEYSLSWSCNLVILLTAIERSCEKERRFFLKKFKKIRKRNLIMQY